MFLISFLKCLEFYIPVIDAYSIGSSVLMVIDLIAIDVCDADSRLHVVASSSVTCMGIDSNTLLSDLLHILRGCL